MERVTARFTGPAKVQTGGTVQILVPGIPHDAITLKDAADWLGTTQREISRIVEARRLRWFPANRAVPAMFRTRLLYLADVQALALERLAEGKRT